MTKRTTRNLHVPLPDPLYRQLRSEAQRSNRPATEIAREAIDRWLAEQRRLLIHEAVKEYAVDMAGSPADVDETLEAAGIKRLIAAEIGVKPEVLLEEALELLFQQTDREKARQEEQAFLRQLETEDDGSLQVKTRPPFR